MATLDVLTLSESRLAVGKETTDTQDAALLAQMTTAVSLGLDKCTGPVVRRDVVDELHDGGRRTIQLARWPVASITGITEFSGATGTALTRETVGAAGGYLAEPHPPDPTLFSGQLTRRSGGGDSSWACGSRNLQVSYVAGRYASTEAVNVLFKQAAAIWLAYLWRTHEPSTAAQGEFDVPATAWPKFGIPNAVRDLLADEWQLATQATTTFAA